MFVRKTCTPFGYLCSYLISQSCCSNCRDCCVYENNKSAVYEVRKPGRPTQDLMCFKRSVSAHCGCKECLFELL